MGKPRFTQADVKRAAKGARDAGLSVVQVEIDREGKIVVITSSEPENTPDAALEAWERRLGAA